MTLPVVVQLGFAGSRELFDPATNDAIREYLIRRLRKLPGELGLTGQHFLCGISQAAIGADTLFIEACRAEGIRQRIFLTQPREDYLKAGGSKPDFTADQQRVAHELLDSVHIVEERVVTTVRDRRARFEEVNLEIAGASDLVLCLVRTDADAKAGGTLDLLDAAVRRGKPVLEIRVSAGEEGPVFVEKWHERERFVLPQLPPDVADVLEPDEPPMTAVAYLDALKNAGSKKADRFQRVFVAGALIIVLAHVIATMFAVAALKAQGHSLVPVFLIAELILLVTGFAVHLTLHQWHAVRAWAMARVVAEIARSVRSVPALHIPLDFLLTLPYPPVLQSLLRTIDVLHLASTRLDKTAWQEKSRAYVEQRLDGRKGQIAYYDQSLAKAQARRRIASIFFYVFSGSAIMAVLMKLAHLPPFAEWESAFGGLAILMPVFAVSALSLAASFDLEARVHTYQETLRHLQTSRLLFDGIRSESELIRLVIETERQLLGENANWASRRSFTSVT